MKTPFPGMDPYLKHLSLWQDVHNTILRQPIPQFPLPLLRGESEPLVDLNTILHALYTRARFDLRLDYAHPPVPPLSSDDATWAATLDYPPPPNA